MQIITKGDDPTGRGILHYNAIQIQHAQAIPFPSHTMMRLTKCLTLKITISMLTRKRT